MNHIKNTVVAVVAAGVLSLVAGCGDLEPPANDVGRSVDKKNDGPAPRIPVRTNPNRLDFGDGEAKAPAKPRSKSRTDRNPARLDFGDNGRS